MIKTHNEIADEERTDGLEVSSNFLSEAPSGLNLSMISKRGMFKFNRPKSNFVELMEKRKLSNKALSSVMNDMLFKDQGRRSSIVSYGFSAFSSPSS